MITGKPMDMQQTYIMKKLVPPTSPPVPITGGTTPFDLAQFYAGLPTFNQSPYARQGLGSYNEILRKYYG